jgi:hypothetical protein
VSLSTYSVVSGCAAPTSMRAAPAGQQEGAIAAAAGAGASSAAIPVVGVFMGAWLAGAITTATAENPTTPLTPLSP